MATPSTAQDEARSDRRVALIAFAVMIGLVLFGVGFGSFFAATNCRQLRPLGLDAPVAAAHGADAYDLMTDEGWDAAAVAAAEELLGPLTSAVRMPIDRAIRLSHHEASEVGPASTGLLVTGSGVVLVDGAGDVVAGALFRRDVTVVGDGSAVYALVVGNALTGQVDALRPLFVGGADDGIGFAPGTCVDTSAVGSPMSFLHDAREGQMLGLRTDEDGSEAVLELRDPVRGRVWAPVVELPRAPAGLQGSRTSGVIGPDTVVLVRRVAEGAELQEGAVRAFARADGALRWELDAATLRAALPGGLAEEPLLRLEVASVAADVALVSVWPDGGADTLLPLPTHGPLGALQAADGRTVTLAIGLATGEIVEVRPGPALVGRDGLERQALLAALTERGVDVTDVLVTSRGTWLLVGRTLAHLGG